MIEAFSPVQLIPVLQCPHNNAQLLGPYQNSQITTKDAQLHAVAQQLQHLDTLFMTMGMQFGLLTRVGEHDLVNTPHYSWLQVLFSLQTCRPAVLPPPVVLLVWVSMA